MEQEKTQKNKMAYTIMPLKCDNCPIKNGETPLDFACMKCQEISIIFDKMKVEERP